jgi:UDP-glucuronate 4-epimerase
MALFKFVDLMLKDQPIPVFNNGDMARDFTYVEDLVEGITRLIAAVPEKGKPAGDFDSLSPAAPWRVVNIGLGQPVQLLAFIDEIEKSLGRKAVRNYLPMQAGDVPATFADARLLKALTGYEPTTAVAEGVKAFCDWYKDYFKVA